jgi:ABC-type multidrug transport system fused ATPase/permease subunit
MNDIVSVNDAIKRGKYLLTYPTLAIFIICIVAPLVLSIYGLCPAWFMILGMVFSVIPAWIWWSFNVVKWKVWAFSNVRNVHELKRKSIKENLIWPDGSTYEKTEIWNTSAKEKWSEIQHKFNKDDVYEDDFNIPNESIIYYSRSKNLMELIFMILLVIGGFYFLYQESYLFAVILIGAGTWGVFKEYKEYSNTSPQITLNDKGIETAFCEFIPWNLIKNEQVEREGSGKHIKFKLSYEVYDDLHEVYIDEYDTSEAELEHLLQVYRVRFQKKNRF